MQSSQTLNSFLIINSPICSSRNAIHIAKRCAKSLSMDKLTLAQKPTSLAERLPFQLCRHYSRVSHMNELFSPLQIPVPAEVPQDVWPFSMCLFCHWLSWPSSKGMTQYIYLHKIYCLFPFPLRILKTFMTELQRTSIFALNLFSC